MNPHPRENWYQALMMPIRNLVRYRSAIPRSTRCTYSIGPSIVGGQRRHTRLVHQPSFPIAQYGRSIRLVWLCREWDGQSHIIADDVVVRWSVLKSLLLSFPRRVRVPRFVMKLPLTTVRTRPIYHTQSSARSLPPGREYEGEGSPAYATLKACPHVFELPR